jgi:hypothetical protein
MTLKEKFENVLHNWIDEDYDRQHVAKELEIDADEFIIKFAEWVDKLKSSEIDTIDYDTYLKYDNKELLEIYKKENGL